MEAATLALLVTIVAAVGLIGGGLRVRRSLGAPAPSVEAALQRALLPGNPPVVDGLRVSWAHRFGGGPAAGCDFYDAFVLDDGMLAVTVGDAFAGGTAALAAMNVVRQALRNALIDGAPPVEALRRANRVLLRSESPAVVTALAGIVDPATLLFRYASAGHPAPLLATNEGCTAVPSEGSGIALGAVPHHVASEHAVSVPADGLLALPTDGCLDPDADGEAFLAEALQDARTLRLDHVAQTIAAAVFARPESGGEATIVVVAPEPRIATLDLRLPAEPLSAPLARTALRRFAATTLLDDRRASDVVVAAGEAVSNAIEHAYEGRPPQTLSLRGRYEDDVLTIVVEDRGRWNEQAPAGTRGRGLALMRELADGVAIERGADGTTVALTFALPGAIVADSALTAG